MVEAQQYMKVLRALSATSQSAFLDAGSLRAFEQKARNSAPIYIAFSGQPLSTNARSLIAAELTRRNLLVTNSNRGSGFTVHSDIKQLSARHSELTGSLIVELEADVAIAYANHADTLGSIHLRERGAGTDERAATLAAEVKLANSLGKSVALQFDKLLSTYEQ